MSYDYAVTVGRKGSPELARSWARELAIPFLPRSASSSLAAILHELGAQALLVASSSKPYIYLANGKKIFYHPSMAVLRWQHLNQGEKDHFVAAAGLRAGMRVLDCTLGLAADAAIASAIVGTVGCVTGLEASPLLYFLVSNGLATYQCANEELTQALRRIKVVNSPAENFLSECLKRGDSYDVIYFDPMFRQPLATSTNMEALRQLAYSAPLASSTLRLALKLAPKVVIKERFAKILDSFGCQEILGGRYSRVKYGIITR